MLKITNLTAVAQDQEVLNNINLEVEKEEIHAIIGPKKSGKTALMYAIVGLPYVDITEGAIRYKNKKINSLNLHERSLKGIVGVFQDLIEIPNVSNWDLMESILKFRGDKRDFNELKETYKTTCETLGLSSNHGNKEANSDGMSYIEAVKNEFLTLSMIQPELAVIDYFDEKLTEEDSDDLSQSLAKFLHSSSRAAIVFSRDRKVLETINPTHIHVMVDGKIILSGGTELLQRIEEEDGNSELSTS